jgi:hypothetical protein
MVGPTGRLLYGVVRLTCGVGSVDDGVLLLDVLDDAANQPLGTLRRRVDGYESKGPDRRHIGLVFRGDDVKLVWDYSKG